MRAVRRAGVLLASLVVASSLGACARVADLQTRERAPKTTESDPSDPEEVEPTTASDAGIKPPVDTTPDGAAPKRVPEALLRLGEEPWLAQDDGALYVSEIASDRSRIHRVEKTPVHETRIIYDEVASRATSIEGLAARSSGTLFTSTYDGFFRTMRSVDGTNRSVASSGPTSIFEGSKSTVWLISPDVTSNAPKLHWFGDSLLSRVPEATIDPGIGVMLGEGTDDELIFFGRTSNQVWKIFRWRPFANTSPLTQLQTYPEYVSTLTTDADRVYVYSQDEGSVVAFSRVTPDAPVTPVLGKIESPSYPLMLRSSGRILFLRSQTWIRACVIDRCAATMKTLDSGFARARWFLLDASYVYYTRKERDDGPFVLYRTFIADLFPE